jgi:hypothetical protein
LTLTGLLMEGPARRPASSLRSRCVVQIDIPSEKLAAFLCTVHPDRFLPGRIPGVPEAFRDRLKSRFPVAVVGNLKFSSANEILARHTPDMDRKIPVYFCGSSFGPCLDFLGRKRIRGSSFIGHHSLESVSVLVRDPLRGYTHQLFVAQSGANAGRG